MNRKDIIAVVSFIIFLMILSIGYSYADEIVIIANVDYPYNTISLSTLKEIYLGEKQMEGGDRIKPLDQRDGNKIKEIFLKRLLGVSIEEYNNYWIGRMFREHGIPPSIKGSSMEIIEFIRREKGGMGYIWASEAEGKSGIKTIYTIRE